MADVDTDLALALGPAEAGPDSDDDDFSEDLSAAELAAADDLTSALEAKDPKAIVDAYKRLRDACEASYDDE